MLGSTWTLIKSTVNGYIDDNALSRGAAIAYYTVFSLAPTLVIIVAITGLVFGETAAQGALSHQLEGLVGHEAAVAIQGMVRSAWQSQSGGIATLIGVVTLLITATTVFGEMQAALNAIWRAEPKGTTVTRYLRARAASLGLVATLGFLLMVSLVVSAAIAAVQTYIGGFLPEVAVLIRVLNFVISFVLITVLFAAIYKILPDRQLQWRDVTIGAVVTALLFDIGKTLIGLYIGSTAVASSFGAAGALAVVLLWVYYSSQIFLLGAEFTRAYAEQNGSLRQPGAPRPLRHRADKAALSRSPGTPASPEIGAAASQRVRDPAPAVPSGRPAPAAPPALPPRPAGRHRRCAGRSAAARTASRSRPARPAATGMDARPGSPHRPAPASGSSCPAPGHRSPPDTARTTAAG